MDNARRMVRGVGGAVLAVAIGLSLGACGGGGKSSSSPTGSSSSSATLKRLEVTVTRGSSASAPSRSVLATLGDLVGWPQVAEAGHCTASSGGVSAPTGAGEKAVLLNVPVPSSGLIAVSVACSDGAGGQFTLTGTPGAVVAVTVEVKPGKLEVKTTGAHVSPTVSQPSPPSVPSPSVVSPSDVSPSEVSPPSLPKPS